MQKLFCIWQIPGVATLGCVLAISSVALSADEPSPTPAPTPLPNWKQALDSFAKAHKDELIEGGFDLKGFKIDGGYLHNRRKGGDSGAYYNLKYKGDTVKERKTPLATGDALGEPVKAPETPQGDTRDLIASFERGGLNLDGSIAELLAIRKLTIFREGSPLSRLRGAVLATAGGKDKESEVAIGLETPPVHPLRFISKNSKNLETTNWLVLGLQRGRENVDADPTNVISTDTVNRNVTRGTFRAFLGHGFGWRQSKELQQLGEILKSLPETDYATIRAWLLDKEPASKQPAPWKDKNYPDDVVRLLKDDLKVLYNSGVDLANPALEINPQGIPIMMAKLQNPSNQLEKVLRLYMTGEDAKVTLPTTFSRFTTRAKEEIQNYQPGMTSIEKIPTVLVMLRGIIVAGFYHDESSTLPYTTSATTIADDLKKGVQSSLLTGITDLSMREQILKTGNSILSGDNPSDLPLSFIKRDRSQANRLVLEQVFNPTIASYKDPKLFKARKDLLAKEAPDIKDQPSVTLWLEGNGWRSFSNNLVVGERKLNNLAAATLTGWLDRSVQDRRWVRVRYEYGRQRAEPTVGRHFISLSYGLAF